MEWCLDCHKNTEKALRSLDKVYDMSWTAPSSETQSRAERPFSVISTGRP